MERQFIYCGQFSAWTTDDFWS